MKKLILFIQFSLSVFIGFPQAQTITLSFVGQDAQNHNILNLQSVFIRNITQGCDTIIYGTAPSIILSKSLGINENNLQHSETFTLMSNMTNPFRGSTNVFIALKIKEKLHLCISNTQGKRIADYSNEFPAGLHKFEITSSSPDLLILNLSDGNISKSVKLINHPNGAEKNAIMYVGLWEQNITNKNKFAEPSRFVYHLGDSLLFKASVNGYDDNTITSAPDQSTLYTFQMTPIPTDGYYVKGAVTAFPDCNEKAKMKVTLNEVTQTPRLSLMELYIPIKAGADGFNIVQVAGSARTIFGPAAGFGVVTNPATDEPKVPFQRGPVSTVNTAKFTVPEDGMYHVVFDFELNKVAIMRVHWGMIGAATPGGWSNDTMLTESAFNLTNMSWTLTDLQLLRGEWKFRYSHGWKVVLDTTLDLGGGKIGVKVNTNAGGAVSALVPGGMNIVNADPGIYTCNMNYTVDSGYKATLTKTGNIPPIDYSAFQMGIIGNAYLKQDGTQANWDENFGTSLPAVSGTDYIWVYNIDFIADKDFIFRQGDDWSGKSIAFGDVTMAGPAAANFSGDGGNFKVNVAGNYTIVLQIAAATETYTVTATKN